VYSVCCAVCSVWVIVRACVQVCFAVAWVLWKQQRDNAQKKMF
jgi:hypothetical protein